MVLLPQTASFPRSQRFVLTKRLQDAALDFQERIIEAALSRGQQQSQQLAAADITLAKVRFYLRLSHELGLAQGGPVCSWGPYGRRDGQAGGRLAKLEIQHSGKSDRLRVVDAGQTAATGCCGAGSWNNNRDNARCANRNRNNPDNWNNNVGVRLVVAHVLPGKAGNAARHTTPRAAEALKHGAVCSWPSSALSRWLEPRGRAELGRIEKCPLPVVGQLASGSKLGAGQHFQKIGERS